ncbi:hypothetical protein SPTER_26660 [Sporomusa termitida]|uniref:Uncharacterized protein n=1 Tax=Sporomusa termitida TaxID=2377 RepID=A0A517DVA0_9FIRM|nr:hypothetical protein SPTER_26660 [Sporomusa termitida]
MNCAKIGTEPHRDCLANQALATQKPTFVKGKLGEREIISYWLPIAGYPEHFIHFGVGVTIDYDAALEK